MATMFDLDAGFSSTRIGALSYTAIDNKGPATLASARYWHHNISVPGMDGTNGGALATAINASIGVTTRLVACTFDAANLTYTFAGNANFTLNLDPVLAAAMGFASGALAAASSYTSTKRPLYVIRPLEIGSVQPWSRVSGMKGIKGSTKLRIAADGKTAYGTSPLSIGRTRDWQVVGERDTALFNGGTYVGGKGHATDAIFTASSPTVPWSWEDFWLHVRTEEYFAWASQTNPPSAATAQVYRMMTATGEFDGARMAQDYGLWSYTFSGLYIGAQ